MIKLLFPLLFVIPAEAGIQYYPHMLHINQPIADFLFQLFLTSKPFFWIPASAGMTA